MLDTQLIVIETFATARPPAPPKPRVRFRDYRCVHCGRLLMRSSLDTIALALPRDFRDSHPLLCAALKAVVCEIRCPKCNVTNSFQAIGES
jgi:phage FluMu protein Com